MEETLKATLQPIDYADFARLHGLEVATVRAVCEVEAAGSGFLEDGRPKILFEGHVFWKQLKKYGVDPAPYAAQDRYGSVLYARWTRKHYKGGAGEYDRLALARKIHEDAALCSASWGLFQIMGYHYDRLGYESVREFVRLHEESARGHLEAFGRFLEAYNLDGLLRRNEWARFAERYNGPGYRENRYDVKLADAYRKFKQQEEVVAVDRDLDQPTGTVPTA